MIFVLWLKRNTNDNPRNNIEPIISKIIRKFKTEI